MNKKYWSQRKGINAKFDLDGLKRSFKSIATHFSDSGYFQEYYGFYCVDQGYTYGKAGIDIDEFIFRRTRREVKWPIHENLQSLDLDTFFDMIEFLYDTISKPLNGSYHSYAGCGYHYSTFDTAAGQAEYRNEFNQILRDFEDGYELNSSGEIQFMLTSGLKELTEASVPAAQEESKLISQRVERAISKYRNRHSDHTDRREAVRELVDVLEYLRPTIKIELLTKDESDLFNIANNFSIRHNNLKQKDNYGPAWLSWIFYIYLATIHLCLRLRLK